MAASRTTTKTTVTDWFVIDSNSSHPGDGSSESLQEEGQDQTAPSRQLVQQDDGRNIPYVAIQCKDHVA